MVSCAALLALATGPTCAPTDPGPPIVTGLHLLESVRVSRTEFEYTYEVAIYNPGPAVRDVVAIAKTESPGTTLLDDTATVASIDAWTGATSTDTIRFRQDRTVAFEPAKLFWDVAFDLANHPPVAAPGYSRTDQVGDLVQLDGRGSYDPDGDALGYAWSIASRPAGSLAELDFPNAAQPSFVPDAAGLYEVRLVVNDGLLSSPPVSAYVTARAIDWSPPSVRGAFPAPGATQVAVDTSVVAYFSEDIDPAEVYVDDLQIVGPDGYVPALVGVSGDAVILRPFGPLRSGATYVVTVFSGHLADHQGQVLEEDYEWTFSTGAAIDPTPPQVFAVTPGNGATGVIPIRPDAIVVEFTEAVDPGSVATSFYIDRADGTRVPGRVEVVGDYRARFTPQLPPGERFESQTWTATVTTGVRDLAGNPLAQAFVWSFRTLPSHAPAWLSRPGVGSAGDTSSYYAGLPLRSVCRDWSVLSGWTCDGTGAPPLFSDWLWDLGWRAFGEPRAVFYNASDLATGRNAKCFVSGSPIGEPDGSPNAYRVARQIGCYVSNHGPIPGTPGHPDRAWALADAASDTAPTSITAIFSKYDAPRDTNSVGVEEAGRSAGSFRLERGDVVTVGPATGTIAPGNLFFASSGPAGVGVACSSNAVDPQPCPIEGGPLYGLLVRTPEVRVEGGGSVSGLRSLGAAQQTYKVLAPGQLIFQINDTAPGNGGGQYDVPVVVNRANAVSFMVYVPDGTGAYRLTGTANLDDEGPKQVPQACIACHGGRWDPETQTVTGASMLPFDLGRVDLPSAPAWSRANQEEPVRQLNEMVRHTLSNRDGPTSPIRDWIDGTYANRVTASGQTANDAFVPAGWSTDVALYQNVVEPYCQSCHQALRPGLEFHTSAQFRGYAATIQSAVCATRSMPHAGPTFAQFWQSTAPSFLGQTLFGGAACGP